MARPKLTTAVLSVMLRSGSDLLCYWAVQPFTVVEPAGVLYSTYLAAAEWLMTPVEGC